MRGGGLSSGESSISLEVTLSQDHPRLTLVSMLAPSPDWFVGVSGLQLYDSGAWTLSETVQLYPLDAGTDSGPDFTSGDADQDPAEPIQALGGPFGDSPRPVATLKFTKL